ncbi:MAG TPA: ATP-binding protein [Asticcacaulis sp.]|nr:ATP-binding protein [Asticcacaulis sp.]
MSAKVARMNAPLPAAAAPTPLSRDEVALDYGLKAQTRLALYAVGFFGIGLPLLLWAGHVTLPNWVLALWLAGFTIGWSAFLALRRQTQRLEPAAEETDRDNLRQRLLRHFAASGLWVMIHLGVCLSAALYGARPDMLLMLCAGTAAGVIFFSAPVLIGLLIFGALAAAGPLLALALVPHDAQLLQIMSGGLALTFAMAFTLNRHMQEHYLLEHARLGLAREREAARAEAQAQGQARIALMETLSREIQTGLRGVEQNLLHGLTHLTRAPAPRQYIDTALGEIAHLQTMLTTTLDNDTAAAGRIELDTAPLDIALICRRLCAQFSGLAQSKGLSLSCNLDALPAYGAALGDEHRVEQVLAHLLSNALLYTAQGRVELKALAMPDGLLRLEVVDSGPGLSPGELAQAFRPHIRIARTSAGTSGAGLGLSLSRALAELMGGRAGGESTRDVGSKFWLDLPFDAQASAPAQVVSVEAEPGGAPSLRVLLIAGDSLPALELRDMLERLGHKCLSATTRERGLSLAKKAEIDACVISAGRFDDLDSDEGRERLAAFVAALQASQAATAHIMALLPAGDQAEALQALGITPLILPQSPESLGRALMQASAQQTGKA